MRQVSPQAFVRKPLGVKSNDSVQAAIAALNSLQTNFAVVEELRKSRKDMNLLSIPETVEWLRRIGYQVRVLPRIMLSSSSVDSVPFLVHSPRI